MTNYSVQKYNENFSRFEEGNEVSFADFQAFLDKEYPHKNIKVTGEIYTKMCDIIKTTMLAVREKINVFDRQYSFEIFGYDFILNSEFNPYLLEINTNPGLEESSALIRQLVPRMVNDALKLTIDEVFETKHADDSMNNQSAYPVTGYSNEENLWEHLCNIKFKRNEPENLHLFTRSSKSKHR